MKVRPLAAPVALVLALAACKRPAASTTSPSASSSPPPPPPPAATPPAPAAAAPASPAPPPAASTTPPAPAESEIAAREKFTVDLESAMASFHRHEIDDVFAKLAQIPAEFRTDPEFLNLRGSCHMETRDFAAAMEDYQNAAKKNPDSYEIRFNIGEVHFVTDRWDDAIREFQLVKPPATPVGQTMRALIDFKLMLCEEGKGNAAAFNRLATENKKQADTLLAYYTQAATEFRAGDQAAAKATLAKAAKKFPAASDRACWHDTLIEFGYDPR